MKLTFQNHLGKNLNYRRVNVNSSSFIEEIRNLFKPVDEHTKAAIDRRNQELPHHVKVPGQTLGKVGIGCEGTHGVFPKCNFACRPCYHSEEANRIRIDGPHTLSEIEKQMKFLWQNRASYAHAQLIGGEVSLLSPEDHSKAIEIMRRYGREPMSFTHGDVDPEYIKKVALLPDGNRRFKRISFAAHFDTTMIGRRGLRRTQIEADLDEYRKRFADIFHSLKKSHGVKFFLAHNMTVVPSNVDQIPGVIERCRFFGYSMFSFQPAAFVGDEKKWKQDFNTLDPDRIWELIEEGAGAKLDYKVLQVGDTRCNRTAWGIYVGEKWFPYIDGNDDKDVKARDLYLNTFGGVHFNAPLWSLLPKLTTLAVKNPTIIFVAISWLLRKLKKVGGIRAVILDGIYPMTFVMHRFMNEDLVDKAWDLMNQGVQSDDPIIKETQERLAACSYAMAHPELGTVVPACVQHSVLDKKENKVLVNLLPLNKRSVNSDESNPANAVSRS